MFRTLGKRAGAVVMLGDAAKGLAAAGIATGIADETVAYAAGLAAVVGHVWPRWFRFKGGRGVATAIGAVLWLEPIVGLVLAAVWVGLVLATKIASISSLVAMALYVPGYLVAGTRGWSLLWAGVTAALVLARHAANIKRMLAGSESTVEQR